MLFFGSFFSFGRTVQFMFCAYFGLELLLSVNFINNKLHLATDEVDYK